MDLYFQAWSKFATFKGRATRSEYWIFVFVNIIVGFTISIISFNMGWMVDSHEGDDRSILSILFILATIIPHISVSVRRIHDINLSGWWGCLFIPLAFPMFIVAFIGSKERKKKNNSENSLAKAVANHAKDMACSVKPAVASYVEKHSSVQDCESTQENISNIPIDINNFNIDEDQFYEKAMEELESDNKKKGIWAKAFAQSRGDEIKAKAMYIDIRAKEMMQLQEAIEIEKLRNNFLNLINALSKKKRLITENKMRKDIELLTEEIDFLQFCETHNYTLEEIDSFFSRYSAYLTTVNETLYIRALAGCRCSNCNAKNPKEAKFCRMCGVNNFQVKAER